MSLGRRLSQQKTLYHEAFALFCFIKEYEDLYRLRFSLPKSHPVRHSIDEADRAALMARWERHHETQIPYDFSIAAVVYISECLIRFYLDNIERYTPRQMASMHRDLVLKTAPSILQLRDGWLLGTNRCI